MANVKGLNISPASISSTGDHFEKCKIANNRSMATFKLTFQVVVAIRGYGE